MKKNVAWNILVIALTFIILIILLFTTHKGNELKKLVETMDLKWLGVAFMCVILSWMSEAVVLQVITKKIYHKQSYLSSFRVTMVGQFFNSITPFSTGGQPAQAYCMVRNGLHVGQCANIFIFKAIIYQLSIFIYTVAAFFWKGNSMIHIIPNFTTFFIMGIIMNLSIILFFSLFMFNSKAAEKVIDIIFHVLHKFKLFKNVEKYIHEKESELEKFRKGTENIMGNAITSIKSIFFQCLQLTFVFLVPYFIYRAVELGKGNFSTMLASQALLRMITTMIPTPGASGGAEGMSYIFFKNFFKTAPIVPIILLYRVYTFYFNLLFGALVTFLSKLWPKGDLPESC